MPQPPDTLPHNPLATADERALEDLALRLLCSPAVARVRPIVEMLWRNGIAYPAREQMDRFDDMLEEYLFHHALRAANSDPRYPRVLRLMNPPGHWFGRAIPGSRWGGDSPDFIYRMIPVEPGQRYEIRGRCSGVAPSSVTYSLASGGAATATLAVLDSAEMRYEEDGSFVLTLDDDDAGARPNHLRLAPGADHLLIRDAIGDWGSETPNHISAQLLDAPGREPLDEDVLAARAAQGAMQSLYFTFYCTQSASGQPPNELRAPASSGAFGGMATQWGAKSNLCLEDDQALVITANAAGALFRNVVLCDQFFLTADYWSRTGSLNMCQMAADEDGDFTYVVAHRDPGIHNWLDTGGLRRTILGHRWQGIPPGSTAGTPAIAARVVPFSALDRELPAKVRRISAQERREQLHKRLEGYKRRWLDY
ncbi:hypothetical protein E4634_18795 [Mangrovimicrobium sediminis]|uniref:DUF1214 domain-containing protein n=1 Tax=Mangrovimicrobium sediminis TaxID=2562682 RepID=A0A4Z0LVK7_9GAMM|nr:hypothetical protein [Haliea sp. SAOS-164]TGD71321.1 hypothetical protein E4634_18795 [Haliea sp. SAOS-164]